MDPEAEEVNFVAAKHFILNASTGLYHSTDFSESLLKKDAPPACVGLNFEDDIELV